MTPQDGAAVETGPRQRAGVRLDERQRAALRDSLACGYLHLPYRDSREALDRAVFGPLADAWESACEAVGGAAIIVESFSDTGRAQVTFAATASAARTNPNREQAKAIQAIERLAHPFRRESVAHQVPDAHLWWFTGPIPCAEAESVARRAAGLDRSFHGGEFLVLEE